MEESKAKARYAKGKIRAALDACYRAMCGIESESYDYAVAQLFRVEEYAHDARFAADLAGILKANPERKSTTPDSP